MSVCVDCHVERELEHELTDCGACHIGPHMPVAGFDCADCHTSTDDWQALGVPMHELDLGGEHSAVTCLVCHSEQAQAPEAECSGCHQPPEGGHFGPACSSCHTPEGFQGARLPEHPTELVGAHQAAPCAGCHVDDESTPATDCASCHQPPDEGHFGPDCASCHTPVGFQGARLPEHPTELLGAHQTAACAGCHGDGESAPATECASCHQRPENHLPGQCTICHTPVGWVHSASFLVDLTPRITHDLEGRQDCLLCHYPVGEVCPAPCNHTDYGSEQCTVCHKLSQ
jgi:hypothetical protein